MSGGLMLLALAAVWFVIFIPSWATRSNEKDSEKSRVKELRRSLRENGSATRPTAKVARSTARLLSLRAVFLGFFIAGAATLTWTVSTWVNEPATYLVSAGALVVSFGSLALVRVVNLRYRAKLTQARNLSKTKRIDPSLFNPNKDARTAVSESVNGWTAPRVPEQLYRGSEGTLIEQKFAEVVELPVTQQPVLDSQTLDEILRRRRANG
jgi:hypothetical protein